MPHRPLKKRIKYSALYYFIRLLIFISNLIPRKTWLSFCGFLGKLAYSFSPQPRERTIYHLGLAFGKEKSAKEILALSKKVFVMLGKNSGDILRSLSVKKLSDLEKFVTLTGLENYEKAKATGKGIIFLALHVGAFDLMVTSMALRGYQPNIIGTTLKDDRLNELLTNYRGAYGAIAVERGKGTIRLLKILLSGGLIAILVDQDTKVKSRFVNFFGMAASTPVGAALLAIKTNAIVLPAYIYLDQNSQQQMHLLPAIPLEIMGDEETDLVVNTQNFTKFAEDIIRQHPEQWVWMHERWKTKPGEEVR